MNSRVQRVSSNRLVRRVRRHANLTTLFRAAGPTSSSSTSLAARFHLGESGIQSDEPVVQPEPALAPEAMMSTPSSDLASDVASFVPAQVPSLPTLKASAQAKPVQLRPIKPVSQPTQAAAEPNLMSAPSLPAPASPPTSTVQPKDEGEPNWRRLQTIYRKHQEKQAAEDGDLPAAPAGEPAETPVERDQQATQKVTLPATPSTKPGSSRPAPPLDAAQPVQRQVISPQRAAPQPSQLGEHRQAEVGQRADLSKQAVQEMASRPALLQQAAVPSRESAAEPPQAVPWPEKPLAVAVPAELSYSEPLTATESTPPAMAKPPLAPANRAPQGETETLALQTEADSKPEFEAIIPAQPTSVATLPAQTLHPAPPEPLASNLLDQIRVEDKTDPLSRSTATYPGHSADEAELFADETIGITGPTLAPQQPLPLQAVWPVQRQEEPLSVLKAETPPDATSVMSVSAELPDPNFPDYRHLGYPFPQVSPPTEPSDLALVQNIHQTLQRVPTGQPTQSSIEVITPRRARPVRAPAAKAPEASEPMTYSSTAEIAAPPVELNQRAGLEMVSTDIGPLPSDLWQLLGEAPPKPANASEPIAPEAVSSVEVGEPSLTPQPVVQTKAEPEAAGAAQKTSGLEPKSPELDLVEAIGQTVAAAEAPAAPVTSAVKRPRPAPPTVVVQTKAEPEAVGAAQKTSGLEPKAPELDLVEAIEQAVAAAEAPSLRVTAAVRQLPVALPTVNADPIQRQVSPAEPAGSGAPAETSTPVEAEEPSTQPAEKIDTDELTRRVYAKLKSRLTVEWERLRRR
jgi:hypothetical protein